MSGTRARPSHMQQRNIYARSPPTHSLLDKLKPRIIDNGILLINTQGYGRKYITYMEILNILVMLGSEKHIKRLLNPDPPQKTPETQEWRVL